MDNLGFLTCLPRRSVGAPSRLGSSPPQCGRVARLRCSAAAKNTFADRVSGDWLGFETEFFLSSATRTAEPQEIPRHYVPDEFRAWDVSIVGFETLMSSTIMNSNLVLTRVRTLPSVGCEADAVATEVSETIIAADAQHLVTFTDTGSFVCLPKSSEESPQKITVCICDSGSAPARRLRVSTVAYLPRMATLAIEQHDGDYSAGSQLPGCGGPVSSFAAQDPLNAETLGRGWSGSPEGTIRGEDANTWYGLPEGVSLASDEESGLVVEVGWVMREGVRRIVQVVKDPASSKMFTREWTESK